ncbi:MAG: non-ribosomal peptide synthetase, partial [bacterium]|nr:non-ribosomal peptide synthetase [bacterium]
DHVLLVAMHHIVSDGWSMGILIGELTTLYEAFAAGRSAPGRLSPAARFRLPELPFQYADFACWQRQWLRGEVLETLLAWWRRQLGDASPVLRLPTDRPRPPVRTSNGAKHPIVLGAAPAGALKALSRRHGVTPFMVLLAAFKALLYRYTGQRDLGVGTFIANRNRDEIEKLIGFFVNTLVLRTDLTGDRVDGASTLRFSELLKRVQEVTLGAYARQDLPFEKLLEELQPQREMSYSPLFQVMLVFQNTPRPEIKLRELTVSHMAIAGTVWANFDWTLWMWEDGDELRGYVDY